MAIAKSTGYKRRHNIVEFIAKMAARWDTHPPLMVPPQLGTYLADIEFIAEIGARWAIPPPLMVPPQLGTYLDDNKQDNVPSSPEQGITSAHEKSGHLIVKKDLDCTALLEKVQTLAKELGAEGDADYDMPSANFEIRSNDFKQTPSKKLEMKFMKLRRGYKYSKNVHVNRDFLFNIKPVTGGDGWTFKDGEANINILHKKLDDFSDGIFVLRVCTNEGKCFMQVARVQDCDLYIKNDTIGKQMRRVKKEEAVKCLRFELPGDIGGNPCKFKLIWLFRESKKKHVPAWLPIKKFD
jgi:hypothetical protein